MAALPPEAEFIEPHFLPLGEIVDYNASQYPNVVAMTQGDSEITWAEFETCTNQVANGLRAAGIEAGARVAYLGKTTAAAFQIMHGAAKVRAVFTPVNWRLAAPEVAYILRDSRAQVLFVGAEFLPLLKTIERDLQGVQSVVVLEADADEPHDSFPVWRARYSAQPVNIGLSTDDVVLQLYTSGTTGRPKGALITQEYVINCGKVWHAEEEDIYAMRPGEECLNCFPIFHTSGAISGQYLAFARGCGILILPDFDPERILDYIDRRAIPMFGGVPTMLQMFMAHPKFQQTDFSGVRYIMYGAAPMPAPLRDSLIQQVGCRFSQGYGATEALNITLLRPEDHKSDSGHLLSVGRPMTGVKIKIVDPEGRELPVGTVGEIAIQSPTMAAGYWNLPQATAAAFKDGWYLTGDGGCLDAGGYLYLRERIKDLIISGGENVYPGEIENVLCAHPSVDAAAVVAAADETWGEVPLAFIVVKPGQRFQPEALKDYVGKRLARYKQPKYYQQIDELPLTGSGKVMKKDLRELGKTLCAPH